MPTSLNFCDMEKNMKQNLQKKIDKSYYDSNIDNKEQKSEI